MLGGALALQQAVPGGGLLQRFALLSVEAVQDAQGRAPRRKSMQ